MKSKFKVYLSTFILIILTLYIGIAYYFSNQIIKFKKRSLNEEKIELKINSFADFGLSQPLEKSFQSGKLTLQAWYFENKKSKNCGVILVHGIGATRWRILKYAPLFWTRGCHIFTFDHRKHGESSGEYVTYGFHEKYDLKAAVEFFQNLSGLPRKKIGIFGESFGAATALQYAALGEPIAFVIAESSYQDLDTIVGKRAEVLYGSYVKIFIPLTYLFVEFRADMKVAQTSPLLAAEKIVVPTLLIHSATDTYTPPSHSEEIYKALKTPHKKLVLTDWGSSHGHSIDDDYEKFKTIVWNFLEEQKFFSE